MKKMKGYMSVEAALVFPVIILVVLMMMGMSFYMYNKCIVRSCACDALLLGAREQLEGNDSRKTIIENRVGTLLSQNGISLGDIKVEASDSLTKVSVKVDAKVNLVWITSTKLPIHVEEELVKLDVVKAMRLSTLIKK